MIGKIIFLVIVAVVLFWVFCVKKEDVKPIFTAHAKLIAKLSEEENRFIAEFVVNGITVNGICMVENKEVKVGDAIDIVYSENYIYRLPAVFLEEEFEQNQDQNLWVK